MMSKMYTNSMYFLAFLCLFFSAHVRADDYKIDIEGAHAFVNFRIKHLGYSWLTGRFDKFEGSFTYDSNDISASSVSVEIDVNSINSNHEKRDNHLRSADFLDVANYPVATFVSTKLTDLGNNQIEVIGDLTLHGVTKPITIKAEKVGEGNDPWGGYRAGFSGETILTLSDFGISDSLGPTVILELHIEGIKKA